MNTGLYSVLQRNQDLAKKTNLMTDVLLEILHYLPFETNVNH